MMRTVAAAAAAAGLLVVTAPLAAGAPASDDAGYLNSTARCEKPSTAAVFGATAESRIAVCKNTDGTFTYRGVRISDGATLVVPAEQSTDGAFVADNNGISYLVTAKSLVVSRGADVLREEPMTDYHGAQAPAQQPTGTPTTPLGPPLPAERGHTAPS
jgi:hypothetical protein